MTKRSGLSLGDVDNPEIRIVDVQSLYQYSMAVPHKRVPADIGGPSLTRQEFTEECDVNALMARYEKSGVWPMPPPNAEPRYLDLTEVPDFRSAMDMLRDAEAAFMTLPAKVRREFDNDPRAFVDFAQNPDNLAKMREWGLAAPEVVPDPPMRVEVINPSIAPGEAGGDLPADAAGSKAKK